MSDVKGKDKGFYRYIMSTRKTRENVDLLLGRAADMLTRTRERPGYSMPPLSPPLLVRFAFWNPRLLRPVGKSKVRKIP